MSFRVTSIGIPTWPVHAKTALLYRAIAISLDPSRSPVELGDNESRVLAPGDKTALASNYGLTGLGCVKGTFPAQSERPPRRFKRRGMKSSRWKPEAGNTLVKP